MTIAVPAGTQDGQVIHLGGQGEPSSSGGPTGSLILTIAIQQAEEPVPSADSAEKTVRVSNHSLQRPVAFPLNANLQNIATPMNVWSFISRPSLLRSRKAALIGLALLVVAGSLGFFYFPYFNYVQRIILLNAAPHNPYAGGGTIALVDPLRDNSNGYFWGIGSDSYGSCEFTGGMYHDSISQGDSRTCTASTTDLSNLAYEVQMTIIKGDCGGIVFRGNDIGSKFYVFEVCQDGSYLLALYVDNIVTHARTLIRGTSAVIHTGLNQSNVIAIVANRSMFDLYVNQQKIDSVSDSTYSHGQVGVVADAISNPTEVVYSDARVWAL